jgi:hypothetical protein
LYNAACRVRVNPEVLQVSNKAECFMLATEPHRPAARMWMPADLGSELLHLYTSCLSFFMSHQPTLDNDITFFRHGKHVAYRMF